MNSWRENARKVVPYIPGEQPKNENVVKLNTNENPYPPSAKVKEVINDFDYKKFRKYPDPTCGVLTKRLSARYGVKPSQVFTGVGSDDVLATAFNALFASRKPILFPDVTYSFYEVWAELFNIPYIKIPLDGGFRIVPRDYCAENGGVVFPNPNAPTSIGLDLCDVEKIVGANKKSAVIVDEAYIDFGASSALPLLDKYDNILVVQTFSKSRSLAGLRVGYAIGSEEMISRLWSVRNSVNSYTLNPFAVEAAAASLDDDEYFNFCIKKIIAVRDMSVTEFRKLGFEVIDSKTNFLFVRHQKFSARVLFERLRAENIFVRYFDMPRINNYLRVTVGTNEEMKILFDCLKRILT